MNQQHKTELKVGLTVILGLLVLIWVIGWAKNLSVVDKDKKVKVLFGNVSGLEIGDNVTVNGVRKGFVETIVVQDSSVIVGLSLDNDVELPEGSKFYVTMLDLMGGKKVEIKPGSKKTPLDMTLLQKGEFQFDIPEVMSLVGNMSGDIPKIMTKIDTSLSAINAYLKDDDIKRDIKTGLKNFVALAVEFRSVLQEQRGQIDVLVKNGIKLSQNADSLTMTASGFIKENKDSIASSIKNLNNLLAQSDKLVSKLNSIIDETTSQKNNLGKLLYDEKGYDELKATLKDAKELLQLVKKQLKNEGLNVNAKIDLF
ncbi:MAG: MlaD family protein [Bacteroidetes bacterium]|nr:MlaD family protein [Bacteroidota bacterium]